MDRTERIRIFQENFGFFARGFFTTPLGETVSLEPEEPSYYDHPFQPPIGNPGWTKVEIVNDDCIEVARRPNREGCFVAILNMASLEDRNSLHNSATGNVLPFKNEFQNYNA